MLIEQQISHYQALNDWFKTPLGFYVAEEFAAELKRCHAYLRGDALLQLGNCADNLWLDTLAFKRKWIASPFDKSLPIQLQCSLNQIPLARNSLDCIVAPLTLEPFGASNSLLDEIDRVLKPMGFIVFLGINPWSLWGVGMKSGLLTCYADRQVKMRTPFQLNRVLLQRGYSQLSLTHFCYLPPVNNKSIIKKMTFLDEVGKMIWPYPAGFYCYIAQKYQHIRPSVIPLSLRQPIKGFPSVLQPALN